MSVNTNKIPSRRWATKGDEELRGIDDGYRGHDASPDAIGGYYGICWYEYFRDSRTGEVYKVYCYDGTNRSKGAYPEEVPDDRCSYVPDKHKLTWNLGEKLSQIVKKEEE